MVNQTPDEGVCPEERSDERSLWAEGPLLNPRWIPVLPAPTLSGRRIATKDLSSHATNLVFSSHRIQTWQMLSSSMFTATDSRHSSSPPHWKLIT